MHLSSRFPYLWTARARRSWETRAQLSIVAVSVTLAACSRGTISDGVTDSAFVATMSELERVERAPGLDSSARVAARAAALQRQGLSRAQLEAAAASLAKDPTRALAVYRAIEARASDDSMPPGAQPATSTGSPLIRRRR